MIAQITPSTLTGTWQVPPSKSMAHRLLICAALANGTSHISHLDYSIDIKTTIGAMRQLGADITTHADSAVVQGIGGKFSTPSSAVYCAESGSTFRFIIPLFSLLSEPVTFTGAPRLFQRPLTAYQQIFAQQGLPFAMDEEQLTLQGPLRSGQYTLAGDVSSQFISGLLFTLPLLNGDSTITITPPFESRSYVELTRSAQSLFGVQSEWLDDYTLRISGAQHYTAKDFSVEGDWSQAAVPAVLAALGENITVKGLSSASVQGDRVILSILEQCGAVAKWDDDSFTLKPPSTGLIAPKTIDLADCPDLGPILCALALFCKGTTRIINAGRLRIKESDRIQSVVEEFTKLGAVIATTQDSISITGGSLLGGVVTQSHNDHRIVMALSAIAIGAKLPLQIDGAEAIRKSWPSYFDELQALGAQVNLHE